MLRERNTIYVLKYASKMAFCLPQVMLRDAQGREIAMRMSPRGFRIKSVTPLIFSTSFPKFSLSFVLLQSKCEGFYDSQ